MEGGSKAKEGENAGEPMVIKRPAKRKQKRPSAGAHAKGTKDSSAKTSASAAPTYDTFTYSARVVAALCGTKYDGADAMELMQSAAAPRSSRATRASPGTLRAGAERSHYYLYGADDAVLATRSASGLLLQSNGRGSPARRACRSQQPSHHEDVRCGIRAVLADVIVWEQLVRATFLEKMRDFPTGRWTTVPSISSSCCARRWEKAAAAKAGKTSSAGNKKSSGKGDVGGCPPLKFAEHGKVVTRFPPEPSGHLHIGHVKAIFLNDYYARHYDGTLLLRFDDTNPSKEKEEYEHGIIDDLKLLGVKADVVSHTSDHFDLIQKYAEDMIKRGIAYMDNTPTEKMRQERFDGIDGACRNQTVEKNMEMWKALLSGDESDACLRAKIDMQCPNKAMRDPVIYRANATPHARTKTKYKAYPTYDLACPIVDAIEGVTHAMRDTQYADREPVYFWFLENLKLRKVHIRAFSRVNFNYTLLSKRKLKWFVETGRVPGWDDPRFATVKGMLRRGLQVEALRSFMLAQGASRRVNDMEWDKFWNFNKKVIDPVAARYMAISAEGATTLNVTNVPAEFGKTIPKHPKAKGGEKYGLKTVFCGPKVLLEKEDVNAVGGIQERMSP